MKVDNKPIIKVKLGMHELDAIHEETPHSNLDKCTCSNKCQLFQKIPSNEGLMVLMEEPDLDKSPSGNGVRDDKSGCTCLKIQPQIDGNLADVHPNIYIPASLLDYPEHIVKYGGGGSGVTVFGGYHPQLGSLVMKHGGHKDLLELVSLYKIERELQVRGNSKLGLLNQSRSNNDQPKKKKNSARMFQVSTLMKKIGSQPIISRVGSLLRNAKGGSTPDLADSIFSTQSTLDIGMTLSTSADTLSTMQKQAAYLEDKQDYDARIQAIENAMKDMKRRIPAFRMVYISPMHLRERRDELLNNSFRTSPHYNIAFDGLDARYSVMKPKFESENGNMKVSVKRRGRAIHLFGSTNADCSSIRTHSRHVDLCFGGSYRMWKCASAGTNGSNGTIDCCQVCNTEKVNNENDGYSSLLAFVNQLYYHMQFNNWKITLAQQTIGTSPDDPLKSAPTASYLLTKGQLRGSVLDRLLDEEIRVIRNLQLLTMPNEMDVLDGVRLEYEIIKGRARKSQEVSAADVSNTANAFVGRAIHKNFHPQTGRFVLLKQFGIDLRDGAIHLKPEEVIPAQHLEKILNDCFDKDNEYVVNCGCDSLKKDQSFRRSTLQDTFDLIDIDDTPHEEDPLHGNPLYIHGMNQWQTLLELALSMKTPNATSRIWTCGLTDGGLHNLFLGEDQIWMFDLGEPQLETIPAFLTKFLMSFFHTLGMEEDDNGDWIVRFVQDTDKLRLTKETRELLPRIFEAFNITVDRLIRELFDGDEEVRLLLLRYVMTQLVSDAAFCIEKWRIKGGGDKERSGHQYFLEKWLWRSLWDLYAVEEIRRRYMCKRAMTRQKECRSFEDNELCD